MDRTEMAKAMENDMDLWKYWGFEPWKRFDMKGVTRRVTFLKPALIGDVAKFYAEDTIIWMDGGCRRDDLWASGEAKEDVVTQRFLFVENREPPMYRIKSFLWGLKGYIEFHSCWPGMKYDRKLKDIAPLLDMALKIYQNP
ncbi:MAG: hypothetical protein LBS45_10130 [Synergistaceae bacterium]|jgi:hypothetical protein|nr:hypothetical protein [Synergistaceae bacterium]